MLILKLFVILLYIYIKVVTLFSVYHCLDLLTYFAFDKIFYCYIFYTVFKKINSKKYKYYIYLQIVEN